MGSQFPADLDPLAQESTLAQAVTKLTAILAGLPASPETGLAKDSTLGQVTANQDSALTALTNLQTELTQKLEPGDLANLATGSKQDTANAKLQSVIDALTGLAAGIASAMKSGTPLSVSGVTVEQTNFTYDTFAGDKLVTGWDEGDAHVTITRDTDGSILSIERA